MEQIERDELTARTELWRRLASLADKIEQAIDAELADEERSQ